MSVNGALNWVVHSQNTLCSRVSQMASENGAQDPLCIYTHLWSNVGWSATSPAQFPLLPHVSEHRGQTKV